jgi:hypothetical protein
MNDRYTIHRVLEISRWIFFLINVGVRINLHAPRLISRTLKLMIM